ncbi:acyl-phosphate glycerol 3-phosphate acyltransferase [PVC group bacterium (ex Bugula neritina AB1)]|nr:acyl-phosphate glycerol 3-phosphate acyltransferase [PVC group bacterium (ex Bugula neritina AB1)]
MLKSFFFSFILGSIPFGYIIGRLKNIDIQTKGSGNIGATNIHRVLGYQYGLIVLFLDTLKGAVPCLLLAKVFHSSQLPLVTEQAICGSLAIIGHIWSPFLKFKGGKGVATSLGAFIVLSPLGVAFSFAIFLITVFFTRYISLGSILAAIGFPIWVYLLKSPKSIFIASIVIATITMLKHKKNIKRLLLKEENKWRL